MLRTRTPASPPVFFSTRTFRSLLIHSFTQQIRALSVMSDSLQPYRLSPPVSSVHGNSELDMTERQTLSLHFHIHTPYYYIHQLVLLLLFFTFFLSLSAPACPPPFLFLSRLIATFKHQVTSLLNPQAYIP